MNKMGIVIKTLVRRYPEQIILIGGAPVTNEFCKEIGATTFLSDPQRTVEYLNSIKNESLPHANIRDYTFEI
jgi:methanogenic corrinoid protein MtbC1